MRLRGMKKIKIISELREIHKVLFEFYRKIFDHKYEKSLEFKKFIDSEYKRSAVTGKNKKSWNDNFCCRASYTLLNKILFVRICEDKGFIRNTENCTGGKIKKYCRVANCTLGELIEIVFNYMKSSCSNVNLYREGKYEMLNPGNEDTGLKYFENILGSIVEKLDPSRYNFKDTDENILGDVYEKFMDRDARRAAGRFYTPEFVVEYMLKKTVDKADVVENPFVTLADISCGSGHFLIMAYDILKKKFLAGLEKLRKKYSEEVYIIRKKGIQKQLKGSQYWVKENIHYHILKNCIYGADIDSFAVQLTTVNLLFKDIDNFTDELNIIECDSLIKWEKDCECHDLKKNLQEIQVFELYNFWSTKFDYVVGNPPYIGHKQLNIKYKEWLLDNYGCVFKDKSDLSFCFLYRINEILKDKGRGAVITSRYFMESPTGKNLRAYLQNETSIVEIVDFYGAEIFDGVGVATSIYIFENCNNQKNEILVHKLLKDDFIFDDNINLEQLMETDVFENFQISQQLLEEDRWILIPENQYSIYKKITNSANYKLKDIADSFQGIITGCDKAFVMSDEDIASNKIERKIVKKWIKNSNIKKYRILKSNLNLIYSDSIENEKSCINSLKYIENYIDKLKNRRECKKGLRKWYQLQWGRNSRLFEQKKIIFSYKGKNNNFALDTDKLYCSADVYSLILKNEFKDKVSLEYLTGILNSNIYEFYFKLFAKKMGKGIYDYYPNSIMDLKITLDSNVVKQIHERVINILKDYSLMQDVNMDEMLKKNNLMASYFKIKYNNVKLQKKIYYLEVEIDKILGSFFELDDYDVDIIVKTLNLSDLESEKLMLYREKLYYNYINVNTDYRREDLEDLTNILFSYIRQKSFELLKKNNTAISIQNIKQKFHSELLGFEKIVDVFKIKNIKTTEVDIIKKALNNDAYTWNAYIKDREKHKIRKTFVKYHKNNYYGLSEWNDEIHRKILRKLE